MAATPAGERPDFAALAERHRRELHVHCYRMLASFDEAEDAVQETLLRAWRAHAEFEGAARLWLYRIATRVCLDLLRRRARRPPGAQRVAEVPWLQPYPDRLLDEVGETGEQPDAVVVERETIELLFLAALQLLPPRQRAVLIARDVLGWQASDAAVVLQTSVAAVNSALQRARETMRAHLPARRDEWAVRRGSAEEEALLARFIDAHERCDATAAVAIAAQHLRVTMPPYPYVFEGRDAIPGLMERAAGEGEWRLLATRANRMPAAASYLRRPEDTAFRAFKLDVLRIDDGAVAEITTFGPALFEAFGLSARL